MKFTKKQFDEIGPWHFNDLCFDSTNQTMMLKIFNLLPSHLQGQAVSWGCDDSVFRDDVFEYLLDNQFGMTYDEYTKSEIGNNFFKKGIYQKFDFDKLKPKTVHVDLETEGLDGQNLMFMYEDGKAEQITLDGRKVQDKLKEMLSGTGDGYKKGELGIIMAPAGIGKAEVFERMMERVDADEMLKRKKDHNA
jgi:hypothetical protein